jgi:hypothetical protein
VVRCGLWVCAGPRRSVLWSLQVSRNTKIHDSHVHHPTRLPAYDSSTAHHFKMPPRNNPLPTAVRLFNCAICDKGYPRQVDYENHLRSYDHNHRQRLSDMKKLTASNDPDSIKPRQGLDMRAINMDEAGKKTGAAGRFTKISRGGAIAGRGFKKVGVAVGGPKPEEKKDTTGPAKKEDTVVPVEDVPVKSVEDRVEKKDTVMAGEHDQDEVTWEEYDFTKPTGCDHANCPGCKTDGIWSGGWVAI